MDSKGRQVRVRFKMSFLVVAAAGVLIALAQPVAGEPQGDSANAGPSNSKKHGHNAASFRVSANVKKPKNVKSFAVSSAGTTAEGADLQVRVEASDGVQYRVLLGDRVASASVVPEAGARAVIVHRGADLPGDGQPLVVTLEF